MEFSDAKALITVDGARRKGKTAPIKQQVDEVMPDLPCIVVAPHRRRRADGATRTSGSTS